MKQSETVEADIMFYKKSKAFNMIDRCDWFHASGGVTDREMETVLEAIDVLWIAIHGECKNFGH